MADIPSPPPPPEFTELLNRGKAHLKQRQFDQALELFHQAQQIDDDQPELHEAIAATYAMSGNLESAIEHYKRVTLLAPRRSTAFVNLGALYNRIGDFNKAVESSRRAVQVDRKSADGYYNLGIAHRKLNQLPLALPAYREAIRLKPQMIDAHLNLGNVFIEMGNAREAIYHFKQALEIDPEFIKAKVGLEKAEALKIQGKVTASPFGRLVDPIAAEQQQGGLDSSSLKALSDEDRELDHHMLKVLDRGIARAARDLRDQLRQKLVPEIRDLDRSVSSESSFQETLHRFKPISINFQKAARNLEAAVQELREHEERMLAKQRK